jgi:hypothetical protein
MTASAIAGHPTPGPARNMLAVSRKGENVGIEIADDGVGGATRPAARGCPASPTASPPWTASCDAPVRPAGARS